MVIEFYLVASFYHSRFEIVAHDLCTSEISACLLVGNKIMVMVITLYIQREQYFKRELKSAK